MKGGQRSRRTLVMNMKRGWRFNKTKVIRVINLSEIHSPGLKKALKRMLSWPQKMSLQQSSVNEPQIQRIK